MAEIAVRTLPHSKENEQCVIGSMFLDKEAIVAVSEIISSDDFKTTEYGIIFDAILELYNEGKDADVIMVQNKLREQKVSEDIADLSYLKDIVMMVPSSSRASEYAKIVKEKSTLRKLIKLSNEISDHCYDESEPLQAVLEETEKKVFKLTQSKNTGDFVPIREVVLNAIDKIAAAAKTQGRVTGISTGFIDLDEKTAGLQRSDLILIAARPSMGKTAFVLNVAQQAAFKDSKAVAVFSLEMSKEQLVNRMFSLESKVDADLLRRGNLKDDDWEKLIEGAGVIGESRLIIDDTPGISISELASKCRKYQMEFGLDMIIIDYLQLMTGRVGGRSESRQQEVSEISRSLKGLARELSVPVIALSQLSRAVEQRPNHRPMLSDLRESGAIEQDADVVMFLYRDEYYNPDTEEKNVAEVIIAKQRNGPIGTVKLAWLSRYTQFGNLTKE